MKKYAAHYLLTDTGNLLKNGIAVAGEEGYIVEYIDTKGAIREQEQMIFFSGMLSAAFDLVKHPNSLVNPFPEDSFEIQVIQSADGSKGLSFTQLVELARQLQQQFPEMDVPALLANMIRVLTANAQYVKEPRAGIYLLTGLDLKTLHFTPQSRLKKIL